MNTNVQKIIFTFWEPKDKIPGYLKLCMATWKKFLPEYEIKILDYSNINEYLGKNFFDKSLYKDYTLPKQADALRCALLLKYGGIWFDCDTIITSKNFRQFLEIKSECITIGHHIGFIIAKAHAKILKKWLFGIQRNIFLHKYCKKYRLFRNIVRIIDKEYIKNLDKWDFMGNSILNKYFKTYPQHLFYSIDKLKHNVMPELKVYPNNPKDAYRIFYFKDKLADNILENNSGIILLHNSWTPKEYQDMSVEEFLTLDTTLAAVLKRIFTLEEI